MISDITLGRRLDIEVMNSRDQHLPKQIVKEVGNLLEELSAAGWIIFDSRYDAAFFGNWCVEVRRADRSIRLIKDRSQYTLDGPTSEELKIAGLWRVFDDLGDFRRSVLSSATLGD